MPPNPFLGVWQRRSIQFDQGPVETSQSVLWIQAETHFADVRQVPFEGRLTAERYRTMNWRSRFDTDLLGFAGTFTWLADPPTCTWSQHLTLTPRQWADTSAYQWLGPEDFLEQGTCEDDAGNLHPFVEHWQRVHPGPVEVWHLGEGQGQALRAGPWAVLVSQGKPRSVTNEALPTAGLLKDDAALAAFSATAWQHQNNAWQPLFGTETCLGTAPPWTPEDLSLDYSSSYWHLDQPE
ncbi:MAG: hypothetical protein WBB18_17095 [Nodosilinea sp.]